MNGAESLVRTLLNGVLGTETPADEAAVRTGIVALRPRLYGPRYAAARDALALFAELLLQWFIGVFRRLTPRRVVKIADSTPLPVCHIKRQFSQKVCKAYAAKSKGTMGWFFGFRLHLL